VRGESSATLATAKPSRRDCDQTPLLFLVENKIVWVLNFDVEFFQSFVRKITFIECDDDLRSSFNGVGQNMSIFSIRQLKPFCDGRYPRTKQSGTAASIIPRIL
jgi:hypothetical protein